MKNGLVLILLLLIANLSISAEKNKKLIFEKIEFEDHIYSRGKKTEIGDQTEFETSFRYQYDSSTYARFRFVTDPVDNRVDNKTSTFELFFSYKYDVLDFGVDIDLLTNDGTSGGTSIGLDLDSEDTFVSWQIIDQLVFSFFPFNFDGEVGKEFNTWDVTRIHSLEGVYSVIDSTQDTNEKIVTKTIPGITFEFSPKSIEGLKFCVGAGVATYQYPMNADFDMNQNKITEGWERREDFGHKFSLEYKPNDQFRFEADYVAHNKSEETGSLLEAAGSVYSIVKFNSIITDVEVTYSKAGAKPYNLSRTNDWFEETSPFMPIYSDYYMQKQDWISRGAFAWNFRLGMEISNSTPYFFYRYQGSNFIFRERESAHRLRTQDDARSHGGLSRTGIGSFFYVNNFTINPEFEWMSAKNPVFGSSTDLRRDRMLSSFSKDDYLISLNVTYNFEGFKQFMP